MARLRYDAQAQGATSVTVPRLLPRTRLPMPDLPSMFPVLLAVHVCLAVALLVPSLVLPFTLRAHEGGVDRGRSTGTATAPGRIVRLLLFVQAHGTVVIGAGLGLTGMAMVLALGPPILEQPWLLVALATYAITLLAAFFLQRPGLRRLVGLGGEMRPEERGRWLAGARRQRYLAYALTTAVALIAFLMSTKPQLW